MGLFDDILKKPQDQSSSSVPVPSGSGSTNDGSSGTGGSGTTTGTGTQSTVSDPLAIPPTPSSPIIEVTSSITLDAPSDSSSIIIESPQTPEIPMTPPPESLILSTPLSIPDEPQTPVIDQPIANDPISPVLPELEPIQKTEEILHTDAFIKKSMEEIDRMIGDIEQSRIQKIAEAESYAHQKEEFAEREKIAYSEVDTLEDEKSQALHVRELLEKELTGGKKKETIEKQSVAPLLEGETKKS